MDWVLKKFNASVKNFLHLTGLLSNPTLLLQLIFIPVCQRLASTFSSFYRIILFVLFFFRFTLFFRVLILTEAM